MKSFSEVTLGEAYKALKDEGLCVVCHGDSRSVSVEDDEESEC